MDEKELLDRYGKTYAELAGIHLTDKPSPLYELLVLTTLMSHPISADLAVAAARELFAAGYRTPEHMLEASWQDRVDALGRGHYRRFDESMATRLEEQATALIDRWHGDLREMREQGNSVPSAMTELLTGGLPGIGPAGAVIFLREAQAVWPAIVPFIDDRVRRGAEKAGLPISAIHGSPDHVARLCASLVQLALDN
jgi:endonuclease III